jgi:hypothetical protein
MKIRVRPGPGRRVTLPQPAGQPKRVLTEADTPAEGVELERDLYDYRRLACGDLVEVSALTVAAEPAPHEEGAA